jgi:hypothetical protein
MLLEEKLRHIYDNIITTLHYKYRSLKVSAQGPEWPTPYAFIQQHY